MTGARAGLGTRPDPGAARPRRRDRRGDPARGRHRARDLPRLAGLCASIDARRRRSPWSPRRRFATRRPARRWRPGSPASRPGRTSPSCCSPSAAAAWSATRPPRGCPACSATSPSSSGRSTRRPWSAWCARRCAAGAGSTRPGAPGSDPRERGAAAPGAGGGPARVLGTRPGYDGADLVGDVQGALRPPARAPLSYAEMQDGIHPDDRAHMRKLESHAVSAARRPCRGNQGRLAGRHAPVGRDRARVLLGATDARTAWSGCRWTSPTGNWPCGARRLNRFWRCAWPSAPRMSSGFGTPAARLNREASPVHRRDGIGRSAVYFDRAGRRILRLTDTAPVPGTTMQDQVCREVRARFDSRSCRRRAGRAVGAGVPVPQQVRRLRHRRPPRHLPGAAIR